MSLPYDDCQNPCIFAQLALAHRPPSKRLAQAILALPIFCRMGSLSDPCDQTGKGGEPEYGADDVDDSVDVGIGKATYSLKNRGSRLIDESRYAEPTLRRD